MFKYGLKLWSTNKNYIKDAISLYENNFYDYIELFSVPDSFKNNISLWKNLKIPYVIHAPHSAVGLNFAKKESFKKNLKLAYEAKRFADELNSDIIIFHPGIDGDINQTVFQLNKIFDERIVVENKPYFGLVDDLVCVGNSPEQINFIMEKTGVGFCLDIGHAIYSANAQKVEPFSYLKEFVKLSPKIFHLCDGDFNGIYDQHKHFGKGNFNFEKIFKILPENAYISVETEKSFKDSLNDFEEDIIYLIKFYKDGV
ncbi:sugar phosphate isomerase/epimerase [Candidatus Babeliales bacterium]|nr:sugar phosphate isomerase/epimerase [Candidatus Babeliales bacterium]